MSAELTLERAQPRIYRDYSPEFKAEVLQAVNANAGNVLRTANEYQINESTLREWIKLEDRYRDLRDQKQSDLASKFESNAYLLVDSIATHDLSTASLAQKATAAGIMVDKMQLLRNQPTSITEHVNSDNLTVVLQAVLSDLNPTD